MNQFLSIIRRRKGSAIIWTLLVLMIFSILSVSIIYLARQDLLETIYQRNKLKAYYLAESGADLAYAALMKRQTESDTPLIESYEKNRNKIYSQQILVENNTIDIRIESIMIDGKWWVKITSTGTLAESSISYATILRVAVGLDNFIHIVRET